MFMETSVYGREFLYVKNLYEKGELGRIQFMRCAHYQDMEGWPDYWLGFPPLMHPTHAVAPCLMLLGKRPETVYCKGSGKVRKEVEAPYGCPYAFESALISLKDSDVSIEMARFLYHVARGYTESFNIYGERKSFEWQQLESEQPVLFSMAQWVLVLMISGERSFRVYGENYVVHSGEFFLLPPYVQHCGLQYDNHAAYFAHFQATGIQIPPPVKVDTNHILLPLHGQIPLELPCFDLMEYAIQHRTLPFPVK